MTQYNVHEVRTPLEVLLEAALRAEEVLLARGGPPLASIVPLEGPLARELGFYPINFQSDLLEPTDSDSSKYRAG